MTLALMILLPTLLVGYGIYELVDDGNDGDGNETITGNGQANDIDGKNGNDLISGLAGNDNIEGGSGSDVIDGGADNDVILGQQGSDDISGGEGNDLLLGGQASDTVSGGEGDDWVEGDAGDDVLKGDSGTDLLIGGAGADDLSGGTSDDALFGGSVVGTPLSLTELTELRDGTPLADILNTSADSEAVFRDDGEADTLNGGAGDDLLIMGTGDEGTGGDGADTFAVLADQAARQGTFDDTADIGPYSFVSVALINDLTADDSVVVLTRNDETPTITIETEGDDALVTADGELIARVFGAGATLTVDAITLIPAPLIGDLDPNL